MEAYEGSDWVRISDDVPVDEDGLGATLEQFQTHYSAGSVSEAAVEQGDGTEDEDEAAELEQDPGRED